MMTIQVDKNAGFCWGVVQTVDKVESTLADNSNENVSILGEIIHNPQEIKRLADKGLRTIKHSDLAELNKSTKVIIRAHGEPPATYQQAEALGVELIDATCPLVKSLQKKVAKYYNEGYQTVIFGKKDHAEVIGLRGVCNDDCIVVRTPQEALYSIDFTKKTVLFSQTTMDGITYGQILDAMRQKFEELNKGELLVVQNTICKYVSDREDNLKQFARDNQIVIFVAGKSSSNGKSLYNICLSANPNTYFIESADELNREWFAEIETVGITGATSTPEWYLNHIKEVISTY